MHWVIVSHRESNTFQNMDKWILLLQYNIGILTSSNFIEKYCWTSYIKLQKKYIVIIGNLNI